MVYQTSDQSYSLIESGNLKSTPNLTCSSSGSTQIFYSLSSYGSSTLPSWVAVNPITGELSMTAPNVTDIKQYNKILL